MSAPRPETRSLRWPTLVAFGLPALPLAVLGVPFQIYIPPFYAGHMGLGLVAVGGIFSLMRFWDLAATPTLGWLSDRSLGRFGRRRAWMAIATPLVVFATLAIFRPPAGAGVLYLATAAFALYTSFDLLNLSYAAWSIEITSGYHERSRVQVARQAATVAGLLIALLLAALAPQLHTRDVDGARMAAMGGLLALLLPLTVVLAVWRAPEPRPPAVPTATASLASRLRPIMQNRALQILLTIMLLDGVGFGVINSMFVFLTEDVWRLGAISTVALLAYVVSGLVFLAPVLRLSGLVGKHRAVFCTTLITLLSVPPLLLIPPGAPWLAVGGAALLGATQLGVQSLYASMMGDITDEDLVQSRQPRAGFLFSVFVMISKVGGALSIGVGYAVLHGVGFVPAGHNSSAVLEAFRFAALGPLFLAEAAIAILIWRYPLTEARQRAHRETLRARAEAISEAAV